MWAWVSVCEMCCAAQVLLTAGAYFSGGLGVVCVSLFLD